MALDKRLIFMCDGEILRRMDAAAALYHESRSAFIRRCILEKLRRVEDPPPADQVVNDDTA